MLVRILLMLAISYLCLVVAVYFGQRYLQYFPNRAYPGKPADNDAADMRELRVKTEDGLELLAWFAPPKKKDGKIIVFYHGNAGHIAGRVQKVREFINAGYGVYLCEYRGFGGNRGSINETGLYADARSALKWLDANGYTPAQWVVYGESIGSGPAVQMALEFQLKTLIIEGGFSSAVDVAKSRYFWLPADYMLQDRFDNLAKIKAVTASLLMVHGDEDAVVHYSFGQKLYAAASHPKQFVTIEGGHHNDLYEHHAAHIILEWLEAQK